ncbi:DUF397 domain-containing protein [Streptomyces sp. NPDC055060]
MTTVTTAIGTSRRPIPAQLQPTGQWRKSSYSNGSGGECVEVAAMEHTVLVRDSKRPGTTLIVVRALAWSDFLGALRQDPPHCDGLGA